MSSERRDEPAVGKRERLGGEHRRVADADERLGLLPAGGADVDVHVLDLGGLLAVVLLEQVDRLLADHAADLALVAADDDPLADQVLRVPAADRPEPEEALVVDVADEEADLVDVADDRDGGLALPDADPDDARSRARRTRPRRTRRRPRARPRRPASRSRRGRGRGSARRAARASRQSAHRARLSPLGGSVERRRAVDDGGGRRARRCARARAVAPGTRGERTAQREARGGR